MTNIKHLQKCAMPLEPDAAQREYLLRHVIDYANNYLDNISEAPAYIPRPDGGRELWDFPIAEDGIDIKQALADIREIASEHRLWFHVDWAYGGLSALCPEGKKILQGIHTSDSIVLDPHKALFLLYGTGAVLVKERQNLYGAFNAQAVYLQNIIDDIDELSPADLSPELTKHFRGLRLWPALKVIGVAPFRAALSEKIHLARYFYEKIEETDGFETGPERMGSRLESFQCMGPLFKS